MSKTIKDIIITQVRFLLASTNQEGGGYNLGSRRFAFQLSAITLPASNPNTGYFASAASTFSTLCAVLNELVR